MPPARTMSYVPPQTMSYAPAMSYAPPAPAQQLSYVPPSTTSYAAPVATQAAPSFSPAPQMAPMSIAQPMIVAPQIGFSATSAAPSLFSQQPSFAPPMMGGGYGAPQVGGFGLQMPRLF